jgi:cytochrome P450
MLSADPPDHPRIRGLATQVFSVKRIDAMRHYIERTANLLIDAFEASRRMDFIADFAVRIPAIVISDLLNFPVEGRDALALWAHQLMRTTDPTPMSPQENAEANSSAQNFRAFFLDLARVRRAKPEDDLFTDLVQATDRGVITEEEFVANNILIFCAGHDTVYNFLGNALLALHRNPDQLALFARERDPAFAKNAVEELLRYDTSLQIARRVAFEDVELGGRWLGEGQYILCLLGAANRDPAVFPEPDRLDLARPGVKAMSFGGGIHHCLGAYLARVETEIAFRVLLDRLPGHRLETLEPEWNQNTFIRGLKALPVSW